MGYIRKARNLHRCVWFHFIIHVCVCVCSFQQYCKAAMTHFSPQWDCSFFLSACMDRRYALPIIEDSCLADWGCWVSLLLTKSKHLLCRPFKRTTLYPLFPSPRTQPQPIDLLRERPKRSLLDPFNDKSVASLHVQHGIRLNKNNLWPCGGSIKNDCGPWNHHWGNFHFRGFFYRMSFIST